MPAEVCQEAIWERLTFSRIRVLRELADARSEREAALRLQMTFHGVRCVVAGLKEVIGCRDVRELGRWWRENRNDWYEFIGQEAGIIPRRVPTEGD